MADRNHTGPSKAFELLFQQAQCVRRTRNDGLQCTVLNVNRRQVEITLHPESIVCVTIESTPEIRLEFIPDHTAILGKVVRTIKRGELTEKKTYFYGGPIWCDVIPQFIR